MGGLGSSGKIFEGSKMEKENRHLRESVEQYEAQIKELENELTNLH